MVVVTNTDIKRRSCCTMLSTSNDCRNVVQMSSYCAQQKGKLIAGLAGMIESKRVIRCELSAIMILAAPLTATISDIESLDFQHCGNYINPIDCPCPAAPWGCGSYPLHIRQFHGTANPPYPPGNVDMHPKSANGPSIALNPALEELKKPVSKRIGRKKAPEPEE